MNLKRVPVYFDIEGKKTQIGTALVDNDMGCATVSLDGPQADLLRQTLDTKDVTGVSIECDNHKPRQHRDAKPPWCDKCGLTANMEMPISFLRHPENSVDESHHDFMD